MPEELSTSFAFTLPIRPRNRHFTVDHRVKYGTRAPFFGVEFNPNSWCRRRACGRRKTRPFSPKRGRAHETQRSDNAACLRVFAQIFHNASRTVKALLALVGCELFTFSARKLRPRIR